MTTVRKILGQTQTGAGTDATLYTVPALTDTVISSITICETNGVAGTFKICPKTATATTTAATAIAWNQPIGANQTIVLVIGITLAAANLLVVQGSTANITFSAFGQENS
jgi:hypothetical protein